MSDGIYVALNGAVAETEKLDRVANNLANASTVGYQRVRSVFHETMRAAGGTTDSQQHAPTQTAAIDPTRGSARVTGRPLDVTLPDSSYLAVTTGAGERYTRAGSLAVSKAGTLTTSHGDPLVAENGGAIHPTLGKGEVTISPTGEVSQGSLSLGRVKIVTFGDVHQLAPEGTAMVAATRASGAAVPSTGKLEIGVLEESNTSVVGSMTDLISASRAFDAFQRAIDAFKQADQKVTSDVPNADQ